MVPNRVSVLYAVHNGYTKYNDEYCAIILHRLCITMAKIPIISATGFTRHNEISFTSHIMLDHMQAQ